MKTARDLYYQHLACSIVGRRGAQAKERSEDRCVLEQAIIPLVLSRFEPRRVLDVGREAYESFYNEFFAGRELWTIDRDASKRPFGAENHLVDDVANLRAHFPEPYFDFVLMNGVFGWGLDRAEDIERAFAAIHAVLRPRGLLVLGWNDTPDLTPVPLAQVQALKEFTPYPFEPLNGTSVKCSVYQHTYSFYTPRSEFRL